MRETFNILFDMLSQFYILQTKTFTCEITEVPIISKCITFGKLLLFICFFNHVSVIVFSRIKKLRLSIIICTFYDFRTVTILKQIKKKETYSNGSPFDFNIFFFFILNVVKTYLYEIQLKMSYFKDAFGVFFLHNIIMRVFVSDLVIIKKLARL